MAKSRDATGKVDQNLRKREAYWARHGSTKIIRIYFEDPERHREVLRKTTKLSIDQEANQNGH